MKCDGGYTLTELLVVLVIIGLITSVAPFAASRLLPVVALGDATERLISDMEEVQRQAILQGRSGELRFEADRNGYRIAYPNGSVRNRIFPRSVAFDMDVQRLPEFVIKAEVDGMISGPYIRLRNTRGVVREVVIDPVLADVRSYETR